MHEPEDGRPVFLMFGDHHAREWPSAEMPTEFAIDLVESYKAGDPRVTDLLTRGRAIIVPVSNPDGFHASRTSGEYGNLILRPVGVKPSTIAPDGDTTGTTEDYSYNATGGYGYTFEIAHQEFHPPFQMGVVEEYLGTSEYHANPSTRPFVQSRKAACWAMRRRPSPRRGAPFRSRARTPRSHSRGPPTSCWQPSGSPSRRRPRR